MTTKSPSEITTERAQLIVRKMRRPTLSRPSVCVCVCEVLRDALRAPCTRHHFQSTSAHVIPAAVLPHHPCCTWDSIAISYSIFVQLSSPFASAFVFIATRPRRLRCIADRLLPAPPWLVSFLLLLHHKMCAWQRTRLLSPATLRIVALAPAQSKTRQIK